MSTIASILLLAGAVAYIFFPERHIGSAPEKTRLSFLRERREVVYENLRDLNFEYRAGKYPEEDYAAARAALENEAAVLLAEIDKLEGNSNPQSVLSH